MNETRLESALDLPKMARQSLNQMNQRAAQTERRKRKHETKVQHVEC